ncbi:MAG: hypothetical protein J6T51_04460 [Kiritimatiellae bacterium]|nr:hypothetical protein [Kiritimatiellia bacterium]
MTSLLLAASLSFTASATGVGKGTPLEFLFVGKDSDRDYEAMFVLDEPLDALCRRLEEAGLPRGAPTDQATCRLWPVGCKITFTPALDGYVATKLPDGVKPAPAIYTGGARRADGTPMAVSDMPSAFFSLYSLAQSPVVFNGVFEQSVVYGSYLAKAELKKGVKVKFTASWDPSSMPRHLDVTINPGEAASAIARLRGESESSEIDVTVGFSPDLTVAEAAAAAKALEVVDSPRVKINGLANDSFFYRAFLPTPQWTNRTSRLVQPFELTVASSDEKLVFVEEDWTVSGDDPKLTPKVISYADVGTHPKTDTCFIFTSGETRLSRLRDCIRKMPKGQIINWYVFHGQNP